MFSHPDNLGRHEIVGVEDHILREINHLRFFTGRIDGSGWERFQRAPNITPRKRGKIA
jgi:hypothetical protein